MTENDKLRALPAKWRDEADALEFAALERDSVGDEDSAARCRALASAKVKCADELEAALAALSEQPEAQGEGALAGWNGDRLAIKLLVAAGFVTEDKANEALSIAHGIQAGPLQPEAQGVAVTYAARRVVSFLDSAGCDTSKMPNGMGAALRELRDALDKNKAGYTAAPKVAGGDVPEHVRKLVGRIDRYRLRMSYNESYFGEPVGLLKGAMAELARAVNAIYPSGETALYPAKPKYPGVVIYSEQHPEGISADAALTAAHQHDQQGDKADGR